MPEKFVVDLKVECCVSSARVSTVKLIIHLVLAGNLVTFKGFALLEFASLLSCVQK